jgi:hypothetical protein
MISLVEVRCCGWIVECCNSSDVDQRCLRLWKFAAVGVGVESCSGGGERRGLTSETTTED